VYLKIRLEAVIEGTYRWTPRSYHSVVGDTLGGSNRMSLEIHSETVIRQTGRP
jgi:hypothetical protein